MATIKELLCRLDNDYTNLVPQPHAYSGVSVIVPAFNTATTLEKTLLALNNQDYEGGLQVIVVDDCSTDSTADMIKNIDVDYLIDYVHKPDGRNRAKTRNVGLDLARYELIFFFDGDVLPQHDYLRQHVLLHNTHDKIVLVGFKENIDLNDPRISLQSLRAKSEFKKLRPNYKKDWRYHKEVKLTWKMQQYTLREPKDFICELYRKTRAFKDFGKGKVVGVWDLPCMVVTNNLSVKRKELLAVGGFDERFRGWGLEDTFLGAKLIANGNYILPFLRASCYHIKHAHNEEERVVEWQKNREVYCSLIERDFDEFKVNMRKREFHLVNCESFGKCYKNFWEVS